jgi:hypothetical protein
MKRLSFSLKLFITLFVLCILGIVISTIAIDKQIDAYIDEIKTEIQIVNNTDSDIVVVREDDNIIININPGDEVEDEVIDPEVFQGKVTSLFGLNIRQEPSVESDKVGVLEYGETVEILEDCGDWYRTENGFIFKDYVLRN